jgi:Bacteriophage Lambda NinG protein.
LKRKLWSLFAAYVKERDGNVCFICRTPGLEGSNWHAGHLVSMRKAATAYRPDNVHSNCGRCNVWLRGNIAAYTLRYLDTYGEPKFRALMAASERHKHWTAPEVRKLIAALEEGGAAFECAYYETNL